MVAKGLTDVRKILAILQRQGHGKSFIARMGISKIDVPTIVELMKIDVDELGHKDRRVRRRKERGMTSSMLVPRRKRKIRTGVVEGFGQGVRFKSPKRGTKFQGSQYRD